MKKIFLTVDTECHDYSRLNQYIYGDDGKKKWGIERILELGKELNIPINFFLDVGESREYGDDYIKNIIELIHSYNQPIFFHLHPDYISGDHSRTYLWEYSYEEKKNIFHEGLKDYTRFIGKNNRIVFRAGRYGVDSDFYDILANTGLPILDLSYLGGPNKMCHITYDTMKVNNKATTYKGINILPNTRFIALNFLGIRRTVGLDSADATLNEFSRYLRETKLSNIVFTMHSWNFIRKWFFLPNFFVGDRGMVTKFKNCVRIARKNNFEFCSLVDYTPSFSDEDEIIDMCKGIPGLFRSITNNFVRFQKIARLNKKYFIIYSLFYSAVILALIIIIKLI